MQPQFQMGVAICLQSESPGHCGWALSHIDSVTHEWDQKAPLNLNMCKPKHIFTVLR